MSHSEGHILTFVVLILIVVFACVVCLCLLDWADYRAEFSDGDPNVLWTVGSREGTILDAPQQ